MTRINPQIVISLEASKITPYAKVGLLLGMGSMSFKTKDEYNTMVVEQTLLLNGGI